MNPVTPIEAARPKVLEFFAGIGLARMGLERAGLRVAWANDYESDKRDMYAAQYRGEGMDHKFVLGDIARVTAAELPRDASLAWASSPCTDLSIAGARAGLSGHQSGTFWHFIRLLRELGQDAPQVAVLENVVGLATSHGGDDLAAAIRAFNELGYSVDVLAIDARRFLPQSRPRLFLVAARDVPEQSDALSALRPDWLDSVFDDPMLRTHRAILPEPPPPLSSGLGDVLQELSDDDTSWWDEARTSAFVSSLSDVQFARFELLKKSAGVKHRTAYRRTRKGVAVWEIRADDISGCLRTARGGSSKQAVVRLGDNRVRVRWMTPIEYARLMGAGDYGLSSARNSQALFGFGDAVAVPVVEWLANNYLKPLLQGKLQPALPTMLESVAR